MRSQRKKSKNYTLEKTYDYVELCIFDSLKELKQRIVNSVRNKKEKWLVFTDNIEAGETFAEELVTKNSEDIVLTEDEVVFIDAKYQKNENSKKTVEQVVEESATEKMVVVATSVMDNGVSFHDGNLRNLVIMADTKESFVQMLGRKREDGKKTKVYICRRDVAHFKRRKQFVKNITGFYDLYESDLKKSWSYTFQNHEFKELNPYYWIENGWKPFAKYQNDILQNVLMNMSSWKAAAKICTVMGWDQSACTDDFRHRSI